VIRICGLGSLKTVPFGSAGLFNNVVSRVDLRLLRCEPPFISFDLHSRIHFTNTAKHRTTAGILVVVDLLHIFFAAFSQVVQSPDSPVEFLKIDFSHFLSNCSGP